MSQTSSLSKPNSLRFPGDEIIIIDHTDATPDITRKLFVHFRRKCIKHMNGGSRSEEGTDTFATLTNAKFPSENLLAPLSLNLAKSCQRVLKIHHSVG